MSKEDKNEVITVKDIPNDIKRMVAMYTNSAEFTFSAIANESAGRFGHGPMLYTLMYKITVHSLCNDAGVGFMFKYVTKDGSKPNYYIGRNSRIDEGKLTIRDMQMLEVTMSLPSDVMEIVSEINRLSRGDSIQTVIREEAATEIHNPNEIKEYIKKHLVNTKSELQPIVNASPANAYSHNMKRVDKILAKMDE